VWTVVFVADVITYGFVGVSLSDTTFMGEKYLKGLCVGIAAI